MISDFQSTLDYIRSIADSEAHKGRLFEREVKPHVPDVWIDTRCRDPKDGEIGIVDYEIDFNRYFCEYRPPRPLEEIEADIRQIEKELVAMLREKRTAPISAAVTGRIDVREAMHR